MKSRPLKEEEEEEDDDDDDDDDDANGGTPCKAENGAPAKVLIVAPPSP